MNRALRAGRWLLAALLGLVLLLALGLAVAWWWAGTQHSLDWALQRFAAPQGLQWEEARGSLRSGMQARRLAYAHEGLRIEVTGADVGWTPLALLQRRLHITRLKADAITGASDRPPGTEPAKRPQDLSLPVDIAVDELAVGRIEWQGAPPVTGVSAVYGYESGTHSLALRGLQLAQGRYQGNVALQAQGGMALQARIKGEMQAPLPGGAAPLPLSFTAEARGPLAGFDTQAWLTAGAAGTQPAGATVSARVAPWDAFPVPNASAQLQRVDLAALWPGAPRTMLGGQLSVAPAGSATWALTAAIDNAAPGPWDQQLLPLERVRANGRWESGVAVVSELTAALGGGSVQGQGRWSAAEGWQAEARLARINPGALYTTFAGPPISGRAAAQGKADAIAFDADLQAVGDAAANAKGELAQALRGLALRSASARGRWEGGVLTVPQADVRTADASLQAQALVLRPKARNAEGRVSLTAPGLSARLDGRVAETAGGGSLQAEVGDAGRVLAWVRKLPGVPEAVRALALQGRGQLALDWQGGWADPAVRGRLQLPQLQASAAGGSATWALRDAQLTLDGRLADAALTLRGEGAMGTRKARLDLSGRAGRSGAADAAAWQAQVQALAVTLADPALSPGEWTLRTQSPVTLRWLEAQRRLEASGGSAVLRAPVRSGPAEATLAWEPVRWGQGEGQTSGRLSGLPLAWIELLGGTQLAGAAVTGDLRFDASWEAQLGASLQLKAAIARSQGDITVLAETAEGTPTRVAAGVREARLWLESEGDAVTLGLRWDSERAGSAEGRLRTRLVRGGDAGWQWAGDAPLDGALQARLPRVGVWSLLAPPGWRLRGSLAADLAVAGTRADPRLSGTLAADDLGLRSVVDGVALQDGRLRARLDGRRVLIEEFVLRGGGMGGGTLTARGEAGWTAQGLQLQVNATIERLRASVRSDRQLTVSGEAAARVDSTGARITGRLRVDQALIVLPEATAPKLGDDVVVRNLPAGTSIRPPQATATASTTPVRPVHLELALDLGNDFRVQGRGIDTRLRGELALGGDSLAQPRLTGSIRTVGGEYQAYGQRLDIERGVIRFTGPLDNPALDILAVRPRQVQRAGVQVTGTAQAPFVRLYSEPQLSEAETLSWLVLGRASATGGAEAALLQQAAVALLASRSGTGGGKGIAGRFGLDELSVRRDSAEGPAITLGKRFAQNFYASYERSLSGALGTLYVFYDVSRRITLRGEAGDRNALDLIFTFSFN